MDTRKTGIWISKKTLLQADGRRSGPKFYHHIVLTLIDDFKVRHGRDPDAGEYMILDDVAFLDYKITLFKRRHFELQEQGEDFSEDSYKLFNSWIGCKRRNLEALGLRKDSKDRKIRSVNAHKEIEAKFSAVNDEA